MKTKGIIAILTAAVLAAGCMAGCGGSAGGSSAPDTASPASQEPSEDNSGNDSSFIQDGVSFTAENKTPEGITVLEEITFDNKLYLITRNDSGRDMNVVSKAHFFDKDGNEVEKDSFYAYGFVNGTTVVHALMSVAPFENYQYELTEAESLSEKIEYLSVDGNVAVETEKEGNNVKVKITNNGSEPMTSTRVDAFFYKDGELVDTEYASPSGDADCEIKPGNTADVTCRGKEFDDVKVYVHGYCLKKTGL